MAILRKPNTVLPLADVFITSRHDNLLFAYTIFVLIFLFP